MERQVHTGLLRVGALDRLTEVAEADPRLLVTGFDDLDAPRRDALARAEVLLTHWGAPALTAPVLDLMPRLRLVLHAAGSVKALVTEEVWARGIQVCCAADANALPVAEFTVAAVLFANKRVLEASRRYTLERRPPDLLDEPFREVGNYRKTVGIVGASRIGRRVIELLRPYDLDVLVYDPYATVDEPGVRQVGLDELVRRSDVVSVHAPALPETRHMFDARRLALLRDGATLVNTARGSLVDTRALTAELASGRISAVLDVTEPEVLPADSPLYRLPNVLLTPHAAGSLGTELVRMTESVLAELVRYAEGLPLRHALTAAELSRSA
ncbi:hydroxyacid dehydrogenase [Streptomyces sp. NPDC001941]|uniref:hydroxyacid dehydrogenase n=1 Tax=Streptomyces sp. NPDC001941 TaxID=3154659 RepID=UPI003332063C